MNKSLWVITYDVASPKRWRKVFKTLKSYGHSVQYSVFECRLSAAQIKTLKTSLTAMIHPQEDRVHAYPLCGHCDGKTLVFGSGGRVEEMPQAWIISDAE